MGTAREVGAGGLENCDQADRAEQGKGLLYGILVLRRVLDAEGQGTSHVHGRGERKKAGSKYMCDTHSEQINELAKALAAAQGELEPAEKNATAAIGEKGKLSRKYADLTAMIDAVRKVLPKHGLSIAQIVLPTEGVAHVRTMLMHESGQWLASECRMPYDNTGSKNAIQSMGSAITYAGLEVQEADVPAIKNEMAGLNRLRERMDNARKDIKRRIAGPLDGFDAEVKALIARIVDARAALDTQVKDFERRDREGRRAAVQCVVDNIKSCEGVPELDIPINPSWLNKSTRQAEIHEDIKRIIAAYKRECEETRRMEQAKADRIALVEATAKAQAEQHGFMLPLSKFAACLTPDLAVVMALPPVTRGLDGYNAGFGGFVALIVKELANEELP